MYERARRIGEEFRGKGINVALAPVSLHSYIQPQLISSGHRWAVGKIVSVLLDIVRLAKGMLRPFAGRNWEGESTVWCEGSLRLLD